MKYIDLFAGCGGLSLGFKKCGFSLELAVEKSDLAGRTYCYNFIDKNSENDLWWNNYLTKSIDEQIKHKLLIDPVNQLLSSKSIIELKNKNIDLIAGGPPCQGFSMAGKRNKSDPRNELVWDFLDIVKEIKPKFILIENVLGINRVFGDDSTTAFEEVRKALFELGYKTQGFEVNAKHYSVPQNRPRMIILGIKKDIITNDIDKMLINEIIKDNQHNDNVIHPIKSSNNYIVKDAISDLNNDGYIKNHNLSPYAKLMVNNSILKNHVIRKHSDNTILKFKLLCWMYLNNISFNILRDIAFDKKTPDCISNNTQYPISINNEIIAHNKNEFDVLIKQCSSKKQIQKILDFNKISPTVMTSSDDYIHPLYFRGLTVREMARLQSFPDSFIFLGKETTGGKLRKFEVPQYTQVGNAVPPLLAEALGNMILNIDKLINN